MSWHELCNHSFAEMYTILFIAEQKHLTGETEKSDQYCANWLFKKEIEAVKRRTLVLS